jgi:ribosome-binding factor A
MWTGTCSTLPWRPCESLGPTRRSGGLAAAIGDQRSERFRWEISGKAAPLPPALSRVQGKRLDRVNQLIKEEVSILLQRELKDPRLGFVTITEVETTKDLRLAKIYVSVLGTEEQWVSSLEGLASARGFIRHWLRDHLDLRVTPILEFRADRSMEHGARIQALLKRLAGERPA